MTAGSTMVLRYIQMSLLVATMLAVAGCSHSSKINAFLPGGANEMSGRAQDSAEFTLYRAVGVESATGPYIEKVWSVPANKGQTMGFRYTYDKNRQWDQFPVSHVEAFCADQSRDLGPYTDRDVRYIWAPDNTDVGAYFRSLENRKVGEAITQQ